VLQKYISEYVTYTYMLAWFDKSSKTTEPRIGLKI